MTRDPDPRLPEVLPLSSQAIETFAHSSNCVAVRQLDAQLCQTQRRHVALALGSESRGVEAFGLTPAAAHRLRRSLKHLVKQYLRGEREASRDVPSVPAPYSAELADRYRDAYPYGVTGFELRLQHTDEYFSMVVLILHWKDQQHCQYFMTISAASKLEQLLRGAVDGYLGYAR